MIPREAFNGGLFSATVLGEANDELVLDCEVEVVDFFECELALFVNPVLVRAEDLFGGPGGGDWTLEGGDLILEGGDLTLWIWAGGFGLLEGDLSRFTGPEVGIL